MSFCAVLGLLCVLGLATAAPSVKRDVDLGRDANTPQRQDLISAAHWATEQICHSRNSPNHLKLLELTHAKEEVVESEEGSLRTFSLPLLTSPAPFQMPRFGISFG